MSRKLRSDDPRHSSLTGAVLGRNIDFSVISGASLLDFNLTWKQDGLVLTATTKADVDPGLLAQLYQNDIWVAEIFVKVRNGKWAKLQGRLGQRGVIVALDNEIVGGNRISLKLKRRSMSVTINNLPVPDKE